VFEQARRSVGATRWHLDDLCGVSDQGGETRATAVVPIVLLCLRCARSARELLAPDERLKPHGLNVLSAAERRLRRVRDAP
jgi:hypothetical protein